MRRLSLITALLLASTACQTNGVTMVGGSVPCDLTLDKLDNTTWVELDPTDGTADVPNPQARGHFYQDGDTLKLKYSVKALGDVYDYTCKKKKDQLACFQDIDQANAEAACRAFEADEPGSCSMERLKDLLGESLDEKTLHDARKAAMKEADAAEKAGNWKTFAARNDNVGNKIQGRVYVHLDSKKCRLRFSDMFLGIYQGRSFEDSNVVGTNPFVKAKGQLLFENCDDGHSLVDLSSADRPKADDIPAERAHDLNSEVFYQYYGDKSVDAEKDCTYSMDVWAQWKPVQKDVEAPIVDGKVDWHSSFKWTDPAPLKLVNPYDPRGIYTVVRYEKCGDGKREKIDTVCNATKVTVPGEKKTGN